MRRFIITTAVLLIFLPSAASQANAQWSYAGPYSFGGNGPYAGFGGYGPYGGYGWGFGGYFPFGGYGFGPNASFGPWSGLGYGPFNYLQQSGQQQALLTQQVYQQQQQAIIGQIRDAQGRLARLDSLKEQTFQKYLGMSDSEKAAVRAGLMSDYLKLEAHEREGWKRDAVVRIIIGKDLPRLDGVAEFQELSESDKIEFRRAILQKYRLLPPTEQPAWQNDRVIGAIMGRDWWPK